MAQTDVQGLLGRIRNELQPKNLLVVSVCLGQLTPCARNGMVLSIQFSERNMTSTLPYCARNLATRLLKRRGQKVNP